VGDTEFGFFTSCYIVSIFSVSKNYLQAKMPGRNIVKREINPR
jgi:hypothetical protein